MKHIWMAVAASALLAGCAGFEVDTTLSGLKKGERPTGSNIARLKRDPDLEGWRQGMDRDEMRDIQAGKPFTGEGGGGAAAIPYRGLWRKALAARDA